MRVFKHTFQTFLYNGHEFKEYDVIGNKDREIARKRIDLYIELGALRIIKKDYTEFRSFRWINGT